MAKLNKNIDDWETDPDFVRDMDEMDQRWGNKRTVGSINMSELIDEVRRDHKTIRENNHHSSQRDYSGGIDRDSRPQVSQKVVSKKVITEKSESSYFEDAKLANNRPRFQATHESNPNIAPKPNLSDITSKLYSSAHSTAKDQQRVNSNVGSYDSVKTDPPKQFKESSVTKRIFEEESSSSMSSSRENVQSFKSPSTGASPSAAFKSIQDKIDAFKKEFEQIESKVAKKSNLSKVIKKSTKIGNFDDNVEYVTRSTEKFGQTSKPPPQRATTTSPTERNTSSGFNTSNARPSSTSPLYGHKKQEPQSSIKSLSERFESMGRETSEDFRRRMEERRREFFDEIKSQVRETRKGLDGFDIIDSDEDGSHFGDGKRRDPGSLAGAAFRSASPNKPKVYTKRETTQEKIVSKFVKENDKVIHDETKRNVERTSSCHGSSEDEADNEPTSIKYIDRNLKCPSQPTSSPIDELKRKARYVDPPVKGSGLMARTLYDYEAAEDDELSFNVDELVTNIEKLDEGWYKGTINKNGQKKVGLFPANYVKLLNDSGSY